VFVDQLTRRVSDRASRTRHPILKKRFVVSENAVQISVHHAVGPTLGRKLDQCAKVCPPSVSAASLPGRKTLLSCDKRPEQMAVAEGFELYS
jgi:hypothetical protein